MKIALEDERQSVEVVQSSLERALKTERLCALATSSGSVTSVCNVWFAVTSSFNLTFFTDPKSLHGCHIAQSPDCCISIADSTQKWDGQLIGLQLYGTSALAGPLASARCFAAYAKKFPAARSLGAVYRDLERATTSRFFTFQPRSFKLLDEAALGRRNYVTGNFLS